MRRGTTIAMLAAALACAGCGKSAPAHIAELVRTSKVVERSEGGGAWLDARVGDTFRLGHAVRTGAEASAVLKLARGGTLQLDPDTVVRFQDSPAKSYGLDIEAGAIELESSDEAIEFDTSLGAAVVERRGSVRLSATGGGMQIDVLVGTVTLDSEDGEAIELGEGQSITIDVGGAIIEDDRPADDDAPPDAGVEEAPIEGGEITAMVTGRGNKVLTKRGWKRLRAGSTELANGTRVRVSKRGSIEVARGDEHAVVNGTAEVVVGASDGSLLEADDGAVTLRATSSEVRLVVPGGVIVARAEPGGTVADIDVGRDKSSVQTRRGRVEVTGGDANEVLRPGEAAALTGSGVKITSRAPARVDFSIGAGDSVTIHDPKAPTAIRIRFRDACPGEGIVELARGRRSFDQPIMVSAGRKGANILVPKGAHRYRLLCVTDDGVLQAARSAGRLVVKTDSGRRRLPRGAPHNVLDADGRRYTVMYQNRLPRLTFRWPKAPSGSSYTLHLEPARGDARTFDASEANHSFDSGVIDEGTYTWWFKAGGTKSPRTKLVIDFDNAAATAYLKPPAPTGDGKVLVQGAVISDWKVSVHGDVLDLDRHRRFSAELARRGDELAIPVRISHPQHGVHYYLVHPGDR